MTTPSQLHALIHKDPAFGYAPWPNATVTPEQATAELATATYDGQDTIRGSIPVLTPGASMYASYVDNLRGYDPELIAWARIHAPHAFLLSITIFGNRARCADVQPGAMQVGQFAHWYDTQAIKDGGLEPWGYTSASSMQALINAASGREFVRWSAHYGFGRHLCGPGTCGWPQADWTQWDDKGLSGQNVDRSVGRLLPVSPAPGHASGTANFSGQIDFNSGKWSIGGEAGKRITWGTDNVRWSAKIQVDGSDGAWAYQGLPFNAPIPTKGTPAALDPARGVAGFAGSIDFDTGAWEIHGTAGSPTWGAREQWTAVIKIDNRSGVWEISGCPFNS